MAQFLVEGYLPRLDADGRADIVARVRAAAEEAGVRYLRSIFVPDDETCFHLFVGASVDAVRLATERAEIRCHRIVEAER